MKSKWPRLASPKKQKNDPHETHHIDSVEISQILSPESEVPSSQTESKNLNPTSSNESNPPETHHLDPVEISQKLSPETEMSSSQTENKNFNQTSSNESNCTYDDIKNSQLAAPHFKGMYVIKIKGNYCSF